MASFLRRFRASDAGATSIEYAFVATLIAMAIVLTLTAIGDDLIPIFEKVAQGFG